MAIMLIGRVMQGFGGGGLVAVSFIAVAVLFPNRLVVRAMAAIATIWGVSAFLGPLFGGLFVTYANWRIGFAFFGVKACLLVAWVVFGPKIAERSRLEPPGERFPVWRLLLLAAAVLLVAASGFEIGPVRTPFLLACGIAALAGFVMIDSKRHGNRLLPARVADIRSAVNIALILVLLLQLATAGLVTYGPFLLLAIHGTTALAAGYAIACISIGWTVAAITVSGAPEAHDTRYIATGIIMVACSVPGLLYSVQFGPVWLVFVFAALEGAGHGMSRPFLIRRAIILAEPDDRERVSGAIPTIARLGAALGAAVCGILANASGFAAGMNSEQAARVARYVFMGSVPFALLGLVALAALLTMINRRSRRDRAAV